MLRPNKLMRRGVGRASEAALGVEELKALDVAVTGLGLERAIERGEAQVAAVRARYESSQASDAAAVHKAARKKKVLGSCTPHAALQLICQHTHLLCSWTCADM